MKLSKRFLPAIVVALLWAVLFSNAAVAEVKLPAVFGDHMVVQRDRAIPIWGTADANAQVLVTLGSRHETTTADARGKWSVQLPAMAAGGPYSVAVSAGNTLKINDVWVGEVWLCSGQSNMVLQVKRAANAEQEIAAAKYPEIRVFTTNRSAALEPRADCQGEWRVCSPQTAGDFSATAYYFGRRLHRDLKVPVGLIVSAWGGTAVEAWTSMPAQQAVPSLAPILAPWLDKDEAYDAQAAKAQYERRLAAWQAAVAKAEKSGRQPPRRPKPPTDPRVDPNHPANLFNGMIHPLIPYAIRGAIWYQGERNRRYLPQLYGDQLTTLIRDWRRQWQQGDMPFAWVQLPNFMEIQSQPSETSGWVLVREGMLKTLRVPMTGMAITTDIGDAKNIHPKNKQTVGNRLGRWALAKVYGRNLIPMGPIFHSMSAQNGKVTIRFDYAGDGLVAKGDGDVKGFAIAGANRKFVWAKAQIKADRVIVWSDQVAAPVAVRYAWADNPVCNLYNSAGIPASPFRTDTWPETTAPK